MNNFFENKNVLVAGGTGMIGRSLVNLLSQLKCNITVVSIDKINSNNDNIKYINADLRHLSECLDICKNQNIVFNLAGIKGSPDMTLKKPASFFVPTLMFSINLMEASRKQKVENFLYTSSIGVYSPSKEFVEDDVWKTFPSDKDRFAGWAKRMGELQAEAYEIENSWDKISIVRPANVYGPYDNFDPKNAMVIPSLIYKAINSKNNQLSVWGDGSQIRDFIYTDDVARGMIMCVEKNITEPVNLGSGNGVTIKDIVKSILSNLNEFDISVKWDNSMPSGDKVRLMNIEKAKQYGFKPKINIQEGIKKTINWYLNNKDYQKNRYNVFNNDN